MKNAVWNMNACRTSCSLCASRSKRVTYRHWSALLLAGTYVACCFVIHAYHSCGTGIWPKAGGERGSHSHGPHSKVLHAAGGRHPEEVAHHLPCLACRWQTQCLSRTLASAIATSQRSGGPPVDLQRLHFASAYHFTYRPRSPPSITS